MSTEPRPLRVLHWPTDVGGHSCDLARAERAVGLDSTVAVISRGPFGYPVDIDLDLAGAPRLRRLAGRARMFVRALRRYDVVHLNFGQGFLPMLGPIGVDLPLLRAAGVRLFTTFQGCDARLPSRCPVCCLGAGPCSLAEDSRRERATRFARRWSLRTFALNPDLLDAVPGAAFLPYTRADPRAVDPQYAPEHAGPLRVAHAPTHRLIKGTRALIEAADRLGGLIELDLIEGEPNDEARRRLARADAVVDQLRLGWYGALSVEAMALGKPVIARIDPALRTRVPGTMGSELPIVDADEPGVFDALQRLATTDRGSLPGLARAGRRFAERWHDPVAIARWMSAVYADPSLADSGFSPAA